METVTPSGTVRGVCPSVGRPMPAADGLLVRIRLPGGSVTPAGLRAVATVAERFGSGTVEITSGANLQVRGVRAATTRVAARHLVRYGLAHPDPCGDAHRNVVGSPLAGHDPIEISDVSPVVEAIAELLPGLATTALLPAKFRVVVDGGGAASVRTLRADLALGAVRASDGRVLWQLEPGGALPTGVHLAPCIQPDAVETVVVAAARLSAEEGERLTTLVGRRGRSDVLSEVTREVHVRWAPVCPSSQTSTPIGVLDHPDPSRCNLGAAPLLGRTSAGVLWSLAELAETFDTQLRFTPWRGMVLLGLARGDLETVTSHLNRAGLSTDPADPGHLVSACIGLPGCAASRADTGGAARALLATGPSPSRRIHLAGCEKRCGAGTAAVLVADGAGSFVSR